MAEEITVKRVNKKLIYIISGAVVALLAAIIIVVCIINNKKIDDSFFVSDGSKYVLNTEDNSYGAVKNHIVVFYNKDDSISKVEAYLEFPDASNANEAYNSLQDYYNQEDMKEYKPDFRLEGKYVVNKYKASDYEGMTASQMKELFDMYDPSYTDEGDAETGEGE